MNFHNEIKEFLNDIIEALIIGANIEVEKQENLDIIENCTNSIAFLISKNQIFEFDEQNKFKNTVSFREKNVLLTLMLLTSSNVVSVKRKAFSTLQTLASQCAEDEGLRTTV